MQVNQNKTYKRLSD